MAKERSAARPSARRILVVLVAVSLVAPAMVATGQGIDEWRETQKFVPDDGGSSEGFGGAVAVDGDLAVVGAPGTDTTHGEDAGAVHVYARTLVGEWSQEAQLVADDGGGEDRFGIAASLDGDTLLVGALNADDADGASTGAAYVFVRTAPGAWTQQAKLVPSGAESGANFGGWVSLDGDRALVGAPLEDNANGNAAGAAYVFARNAIGTWTQQARLVAPDGDASDQFGEGVSLGGDTALVGAPSDHDPGAEDTGSAYVLQESEGQWSLQKKFENPEPNDEDQFGAELSLDGDVALVASPYDDSHGTDAGSVYAYVRANDGTWSLDDTLRDTDGGFLASFGGSVSLDGDRALIGSPRDTNDNGWYAGSAYIFSRTPDGWTQETKVIASDGAADDEFGAAGSIDGGTALVGAPAAFESHPGAAYVYGHLLEQVNDRVEDATDTDGTAAPTS